MKNVIYSDVLVKPWITEKASLLLENGKYVFQVCVNSNKLTIQKAVEQLFNVKVKKVNIINTLGKNKRFKGRPGRRADSKKAVVTLLPNYKIDVFTGGQ
ncbi:50S ribosomal protein L23 [Rickettsiales endosymbiont of Paramecium tredecaurelia]|uniref:50S ribosomal protein L23 n=1 Tax=Candidatus Sarmatiella mevalonica TaxID=2770581 RepID=UPI0019235E7D|nr:50S ribosomal protein L23 [Candidatus Sarmatiella mevalonica]MBL3284577.1 50S ribosomal protein L23 [Candidatus Sarmatiella mevalonica]